MAGEKKHNKNIMLAGVSGAVALAMVAMTYASIPLIFESKDTAQNVGQSGTIIDRNINVAFDANVNSRLNWSFKPVQRKITLKIGESGQVFYRAKNLSDRTITGTAVYNATPMFVGKFFTITDCFCFTSHTLKPGQSVDLPVSFFIDPALDGSWDLKKLKTITLSYTFYEAKKDKAAIIGVADKAMQVAQRQTRDKHRSRR